MNIVPEGFELLADQDCLIQNNENLTTMPGD